MPFVKMDIIELDKTVKNVMNLVHCVTMVIPAPFVPKDISKIPFHYKKLIFAVHIVISHIAQNQRKQVVQHVKMEHISLIQDVINVQTNVHSVHQQQNVVLVHLIISSKIQIQNNVSITTKSNIVHQQQQISSVDHVKMDINYQVEIMDVKKSHQIMEY